MPHWRYIACHAASERSLERRAVQTTLTQAARAAGVPEDRLPQVTRIDGEHFIVKVRHMDLAGARAWLPAIRVVRLKGADVPVQIETLSSSGTIKTLTDRLGILRTR